jgi:hypothetical protein
VATQEVPGQVTVQVPRGAASAGTGLTIALPEVMTSLAESSGQSVNVSLPNQQPLPEWIRYDAATRTLVMGTVPADALPLSVVVRVGDQLTVIEITETQTNL